MAIKGSLQEASLPDVLQLLALGQKTGCLSVTDRANFGNIFFERGRITFASIVNRRDRLGDLLVKNDRIDPAELDAAIEEQQRRPELRIGELLVERGVITREEVETFVRIQIEEAVYLLFTWSRGSFYFEAGQRPEPGALLVSINPENLLLEGARRIDEWGLIEKRVPSMDVVFRIVRDPLGLDEVELSGEQRKIIPLLNGRRTAQDLADESGLVEFDVGKALFGLAQAGFIESIGRREARRAPQLSSAHIDEHRNLGIAFYRTGMHEEAEREFRRVVELDRENLDARFHLGLVALAAGHDRAAVGYFKEVVEIGGARASALHNMALALERMGRLSDARAALDAAESVAGGRPRILLSRGIVCTKAGGFRAAAESFASYRETLGGGRPPESYYAFAMLAEAGLGHMDGALALGREGAEGYPRSAPVLLHLGLLMERSGDAAGAERTYHRAAGEDAGLAPLHKALGDMAYRRGAYDDAADAYRTVIELDPSLGDDVYVKLANIHYRRMERDSAISLWRKALEINPENRIVRTNLELVTQADRD